MTSLAEPELTRSASQGGAVARVARWVVAHRRRVAIGWVVLLVLAMAISHAAKPHFVNNLSLPGTESQRASELLKNNFRAQSGDADQIVLHVDSGRVTDAAVRARVTPTLARVARLPHVTGVVSPFTAGGARAVSADGRTAFATVTFDDRDHDRPRARRHGVTALVRLLTVTASLRDSRDRALMRAAASELPPAAEVVVTRFGVGA